MYQIQFAPDGQRWQKVKSASSADKLWNDFCFNPKYRQHIHIIHCAKFRLINIDNDFVIGTLKYEPEDSQVISSIF